MQKDIRETALYPEAEEIYRVLRQPGTGRISDAAEIHAAPDGTQAVFAGTLMDKLEADHTGMSEIGFVPCVLTPDGLVHPFAQVTGENKNDVVDYMEQCNLTQDLNGSLVTDESGRFPGLVSVRVLPK